MSVFRTSENSFRLASPVNRISSGLVCTAVILSVDCADINSIALFGDIRKVAEPFTIKLVPLSASTILVSSGTIERSPSLSSVYSTDTVSPTTPKSMTGALSLTVTMLIDIFNVSLPYRPSLT